MKNVLIINAHQFYEGISPGQLNNTIVNFIAAEMTKYGYQVKQSIIEQGYDVNNEIDKHLWADIIILQSPVYWFGPPWIYKKYIDEVFTSGFTQQKMAIDDGRTRSDPNKQYGTGGRMQGKKYMVSLTWNAPKEAFENENQYLLAGKTVDDVFISNTSVYKFCGTEILPSFSCYNVVKQADVEGDLARLRDHLTKFVY